MTACMTAVVLADAIPAAARAGYVLAVHSAAWAGGAVFAVGRTPFLATQVAVDARVKIFALERILGMAAAFAGSAIAAGGIAIARAVGWSPDDPAPYRAPTGGGTAILLAPPAPFGAGARGGA